MMNDNDEDDDEKTIYSETVQSKNVIDFRLCSAHNPNKMHVHLTHKKAGREKIKDIVVKTALPSGQICPRYCTEGNGKQK